VATSADATRCGFTQQQLIARLTSLFGILSLRLVWIGLCGVTGCNVGSRTNEIGVRVAWGADRGQVVRLVLRGAFTVLWKAWAAGSRFPFPEEPERLAVPADQGRRFDEEESRPPLKESGAEDRRDTSGIREPPSADLMFLIKGQLLAEKQILGGQRRSGVHTSSRKPDFHRPQNLLRTRAAARIPLKIPGIGFNHRITVLQCSVRYYSPTFVELSFMFRAIRSICRGQVAVLRFSVYGRFLIMVPKKGLEPPHPCGYMDLNHARLPIPPLRLGNVCAA
jgi:hypothetical protein